jgi:hypothetical protein
VLSPERTTRTVTVEKQSEGKKESKSKSKGSGDGAEEDSSGGSQASGSGSGPSVSEFIQRADAICAELNARAGDLPTNSLGQLRRSVAVAEQAVGEGIARLQQLQVAAKLQTEFSQYIAAVEDQSAVLQQIGQAAAARDIQSVQALIPELQRARDRKSEIAINAGFSECGSS